jgi:hypothetical protein
MVSNINNITQALLGYGYSLRLVGNIPQDKLLPNQLALPPNYSAVHSSGSDVFIRTNNDQNQLTVSNYKLDYSEDAFLLNPNYALPKPASSIYGLFPFAQQSIDIDNLQIRYSANAYPPQLIFEGFENDKDKQALMSVLNKPEVLTYILNYIKTVLTS